MLAEWKKDLNVRGATYMKKQQKHPILKIFFTETTNIVIKFN